LREVPRVRRRTGTSDPLSGRRPGPTALAGRLAVDGRAHVPARPSSTPGSRRSRAGSGGWSRDGGHAFLLGLLSDVDSRPCRQLAERATRRRNDDPARCAADEFCGGDQHLRRDLQARQVGYVLAVAKSHRVTTRAVAGPASADQLADALPSRAWNRLSAGTKSYDS
jgi:hypothetical protein